MQYVIYHFISHQVEETEAFAERLARITPKGTTLALDGDLGAGKTAFTRGFAQGLGIAAQQVSSPTFTIKHEYYSQKKQLKLNHFDVYRLENAEEFWRGGFQEAFTTDDITLIEWADFILPALPSAAWRIRIERIEEVKDDINWFDLAQLDLSEQLSSDRRLVLCLPLDFVALFSDFIQENGLLYQGEC